KSALSVVTNSSSPEPDSKDTALSTQDAQPVDQSRKPVAAAPGPLAADAPGQKQPSLEILVAEFVAKLEKRFPTRMKQRPRAIKRRVFRLLMIQLPPHPRPAGRRPKSRVTKAAKLYQEQVREKRAGTRKEVNWAIIASQCIPGFSKIRSNYYRAVVL